MDRDINVHLSLSLFKIVLHSILNRFEELVRRHVPCLHANSALVYHSLTSKTIFARRSVVDEARIYISGPLSHLCSMYYVRVRWGSAARFRPKATVGWR